MAVIGVLALQGAFAEHIKKLSELGAESFEIRQLKDLDRKMNGLIIPGGESTVQGKLLRELDLFEPIKKLIEDGMPVFGTCAGMILLAEKTENDSRSYFGTMPMTVRRNAYGRQLGSFFTKADFDGREIPMTFIRAPYISDEGSCQILAETGGHIVAARYENQLAAAFHPELNDDNYVHQYFLDMIGKA
ncbi:pyridoxal 5'-phosphate synthase glutaminase subunit PdxT [uncultured Ruminococcus sp.]|uniref:pyridoxal 5'-phosphate synthase glutaminase subunit PdxT n=1 Tax=uncultured Ruminococcus sp. TaxID=165186 RepID=UPI0025D74E3D|nr:pyridoxal 5'-phosphate synthase glutaminase subunit PdxT [uncultured Ruminococcus sp.]